MCKVSVIIPVYNMDGFLRNAVESVLAGDFQDFEIVLVNDGSTDDTLKVCRKLAEEDPRIRVFTKENGGVGSARNFGLEQARGEYIAFVDGDDQVSRDYLAELVGFAEEHQLDWVACACQRYYDIVSDETEAWIEPEAFPERVSLKGEEARDTARKAIFQTPWEKDLPSNCMGVYRRSLIRENDLHIPESLAYGEDRLFNYRVADRLEGFGYIPKMMYYIVLHESSAQRSMYGSDIVEQVGRLVEAFHREVFMPTGKWSEEALHFFYNQCRIIMLHGIFLTEDREKRRRGYRKFDQFTRTESVSHVWEQLKWRHVPRLSLRHRLFYPFLKGRRYGAIERIWRPLVAKKLKTF